MPGHLKMEDAEDEQEAISKGLVFHLKYSHATGSHAQAFVDVHVGQEPVACREVVRRILLYVRRYFTMQQRDTHSDPGVEEGFAVGVLGDIDMHQSRDVARAHYTEVPRKLATGSWQMECRRNLEQLHHPEETFGVTEGTIQRKPMQCAGL